MRKNRDYFVGVLLGTLLVVCLCSCGKSTTSYVTESKQETQKQPEVVTELLTEEKEKRILYVYVCGQVKNPGVYTLEEGSRIRDVFELAGGFTEIAATDYWNQARLLQDGEMIYVPSKEEVSNRFFEQDTTGNADTEKSNKVNINTASKEELMTLPGIGESKALAIIAYRQTSGPFTTLEELKKVEGIKDAVFSKVKDLIEI